MAYIKLKDNDTIEVGEKYKGVHNYLLFIRDLKDHRAWPLARHRTSGADSYTFQPTRNFPHDRGLHPRQGWSILEAKILEDHYQWIEDLEAKKGRTTIKVNLQERLYGPRSALLDFLDTYKDRIEFWDGGDI